MQETSSLSRNVLDQCLLFSGLDEAAVTELLTYATRRGFGPGEVIFRVGSPGQSMMVVIKGAVRIALPERSGRSIILADLKCGSILGEVALFDGKDRSADATAVTACDLLVLERRDVLAFLERHPSTCLKLLEVVCARLRGADQRMMDIGFLGLPSRLAKILLLRSEAGRAHRASPAKVADSQGDLAAMVGCSRENVNRCLRQMQQRGIVALREGWIVVLQPDALQSIIDIA